jgi:uncharacterized protein YcbX
VTLPYLAQICRHPIKSIGYETLETAALTQGRPLPFDRIWAIAHANSDFTDVVSAWAPKMKFLRGAASPDLMAVRATLHADGQTLTLNHPTCAPLTITLDTSSAQPTLIDWVQPLWPTGRPAASHIVRNSNGALADNPEPFLSILNLASNRALGREIGIDLSIHRWRGNLWVDGLAPWQEFELIGRSLRVGGATLKVVSRIERCKATMANPDTGAVDADTLGALKTNHNHQDFGVFALVTASGPIRTGDPLEILA